MSYENGLFIFRRDLRMIDNTGLLLANSKCKKIYTIFIFTPEQVGNKNEYKSNNAIQFMLESLEELEHQIKSAGGKLYFFYGDNTKIVKHCLQDLDIDYVGFNADYSPYAIARDDDIAKICKTAEIEMEKSHDYYLHEPGTIVNGSGTPYQKFTPYYNTAMRIPVLSPVGQRKIHFAMTNKQYSNTISLVDAFSKLVKENEYISVHGGRTNAIKTLHNAIKNQKQYSNTHNDLTKNTTQLSAYIKFGCVSIREVHKAFKSNAALIRQLYWRDFYMNILYSNPKVLGSAMKPNYAKIKWHFNSKWFEAWKEGTTGFPIVDAGMREMNQTGYMHNRARLIVASFLVKTMLIDWRRGEKYFASKLTDYDPASNNGNWQWCASTGADSQPYFRIFNPWSQSEEHDPEAIYIKKWVPELAGVPANHIHKWNESWTKYKDVEYDNPICDYADQKEIALKMYKTIF